MIDRLLLEKQHRLAKVCGLRRVEDVTAATEAGADLIGLVLAPSRRRVSAEEARALLSAVPGHPPAVGVFVDEEIATINALAAHIGLTYAQLSGSESAEAASGLAVPYLKVLHPYADTSIEEMVHIINEHHAAAGFIVDSPSPQGGGSGVLANWRIAAQIVAATRRPVLLAGGLNPENVASGLEETLACGADVSGGIERDGWKDPALLAAFVHAVRRSTSPTSYSNNERTGA